MSHKETKGLHRRVPRRPAPGSSEGKVLAGALMLSVLLLAVAVGCYAATDEREGAAAPPPQPPPTSQPPKAPDPDTPCAPTRALLTPDLAVTEKFRAYADDNTTLEDWTGGDGTWSVPLPDGRTLWTFADSFLGRVNPPDDGHSGTWRDPDGMYFVRNAGLLQDTGGRLTRTLIGHPLRGPRSWIPPDPGYGMRVEPGASVVEPRSTKRDAPLVVRNVGIVKAGRGNGTTVRTSVATIDLKTLEPETPNTFLPRSGDRPENSVFYGYDTLVEGGYTYVYGGTSNTASRQRGYVARVPVGRLDDPKAWRHWDAVAGTWRRDPSDANAMIDGVAHGYNVVRTGGTYLLFTTDPTVYAGGVSRIVTYWGCSPAGPWRGPYPAYRPPEVGVGTRIAFNPHVHPQFRDAAGTLVSYDLNNWNNAPASHADLDTNRPRFLRARFVPAP